MKKAKKILALLLCAVLLVGASIAGTVAYLTSEDKVTNTFTVGNVIITMDEAPVNEDGQATTGNRVKENKYHLLPGMGYDKDPTIHVDADSEDCYVFVKIVNEISAIEDSANTIHDWMIANDWVLMDAVNGVYYYNSVCSDGDDIVVFDGFEIADTVTNETLAVYEGKSIVVTAYAVQKAGFDSATAAWAAAPSDWVVS